MHFKCISKQSPASEIPQQSSCVQLNNILLYLAQRASSKFTAATLPPSSSWSRWQHPDTFPCCSGALLLTGRASKPLPWRAGIAPGFRTLEVLLQFISRWYWLRTFTFRIPKSHCVSPVPRFQLWVAEVSCDTGKLLCPLLWQTSISDLLTPNCTLLMAHSQRWGQHGMTAILSSPWGYYAYHLKIIFCSLGNQLWCRTWNLH